MSGPLDRLLPLLPNVSAHGSGYRADCPLGHRSRGTVSIHEGDDGRVLLKCWAGHTAAEVIGALGLTLADLFVEPVRDYSPQGRKAAADFRTMTGWRAALAVLEREATVISIAAVALRDGDTLTGADRERLAVACQRIDDARAVLT